MRSWLIAYGSRTLVIGIVMALLIALGPAALRALQTRRRVHKIRRGQATAADATLLYARMLHVMKRRGYQKPPWFTPREFAATLPASPAAAKVEQFTNAYNALRFGGDAAAARQLGQLLDELASADV